MKDHFSTQQEFDEFCEEYEQWCDEQTAIWGFESKPCQQDQESAAGYRIEGILALNPIPVKESV